MSQRPRDNFVEGFNYYVPAMQAGADLGQLLKQRVSLGIPAVAGGAIATGVDADGAVAKTAVSFKADSPYGRNIRATASGATGGDLTITLYGRDYLGQPIRSTIVVANGSGTSAVEGLKSFMYLDAYEGDGGAGNAVTVTLAWGARLGLPYKTRAVEREYANKALAAAGTLTAPVVTDPATIATGDPRGQYAPTSTLNGTTEIEIDAVYDNSVNAAGNGGLHGIRHFN